MLTLADARRRVFDIIGAQPDWLEAGDEILLLDQKTIEKPWGWVFFYTSKQWYETQDFRYAIAGNAPILVERATGRCIVTGTALPVEDYLRNYERTGDPHRA